MSDQQRLDDIAANLRGHGFATEPVPVPEVPRLTEMERIRLQRMADHQAAQEEAKAVLRRQHSRLLAAADPGLRLILELHAPRFDSYSFGECDGCDYGGYEGEAPDWPCSTYVLAERIITGRPE